MRWMKLLSYSLLIFGISCLLWTRADPEVEIGGHMASTEREPIMGVCGLCPSGVQWQSPWSVCQGRSPPEVERFLVLSYVWNGANLLCLWAVLWSLMVAAVPMCVHSFVCHAFKLNIVIEVYGNFSPQHGYSWYTPYTYIEKRTSRARRNVDRKISLMSRD